VPGHSAARRETAARPFRGVLPRRLIGKIAKLGPSSEKLARDIFARLGRPGQKAIYGLSSLARHYSRDDIEAACAKALTLATPSYQALKRILERGVAAAEHAPAPALTQSSDVIRAIDDYQAFFELHSQSAPPSSSTTNPLKEGITRR
jgi:hypothetical protein